MKALRAVLDLPGNVENQLLSPQSAFDHLLPIALKTLIAGSPCPGIRYQPFGCLPVVQKLVPVVGIAEELNLQALVVIQRRQQQTNLVLKFVQFRNLALREIGRLENKTFRDISALRQAVEDHQIPNKITVGCLVKHGEPSKDV